MLPSKYTIPNSDNPFFPSSDNPFYCYLLREGVSKSSQCMPNPEYGQRNSSREDPFSFHLLVPFVKQKAHRRPWKVSHCSTINQYFIDRLLISLLYGGKNQWLKWRHKSDMSLEQQGCNSCSFVKFEFTRARTVLENIGTTFVSHIRQSQLVPYMVIFTRCRLNILHTQYRNSSCQSPVWFS